MKCYLINILTALKGSQFYFYFIYFSVFLIWLFIKVYCCSCVRFMCLNSIFYPLDTGLLSEDSFERRLESFDEENEHLLALHNFMNFLSSINDNAYF